MLALVWILSACGGTQAPPVTSVPSITILSPQMLPTTPDPVPEVCGVASSIPDKPIALQCGKRMFAFNLQTLWLKDCILKKNYQIEGGKIYLYSCKESETFFAFYWTAKNHTVNLYRVPSLPCIIPVSKSQGYTISE